MTATILEGDALERLAGLADGSVQCVVSSPPYFGLRDYGTAAWEGGDPACDHKTPPSFAKTTLGTASGGNAMSPEARARWAEGQRTPYKDTCPRCGARRVDRQLGLEATPDEFVERLVGVFREVRRVLRDDGTVWLNLGDSYAGSGKGGHSENSTLLGGTATQQEAGRGRRHDRFGSCKPKDLIGVPWMLAFALRADGWYLRSEIVWSKPNPMPESVTDRPTSSHEKLFLLSKSPRYFYDADAIRESGSGRTSSGVLERGGNHQPNGRAAFGATIPWKNEFGGRNKRNVWEVTTQPFAEAHFATFPTRLVEPCVLAGSSPRACGVCGAPWMRVVEAEGGLIGGSWHPHENDLAHGQRGGGELRRALATYRRVEKGSIATCEHDDDTGRCVVLDPFAGSGTVGVVCEWLGRDFVGVELSAEYAEMARRRILAEGPIGRPARRPRADAAQLDLLA